MIIKGGKEKFGGDAGKIYRYMFEELERERGFTFEGAYVLDADEKMNGGNNLISEIIKRGTKGKIPDGLDKEQANLALMDLTNGIVSRLRKANGKFKPYIYSTGGSKTSETKEQRAAVEHMGANVEYTIMAVNGIVLMEPLGQANNATYIAEDKEGLEEAITNLGRRDALKSGVIHSIRHDKYELPIYNYASRHILILLDYAINNPQELWRVTKENNGCGLKKITESMPNTTADVIAYVNNALKDKEVSKEDVTNNPLLGKVRDKNILKSSNFDNI